MRRRSRTSVRNSASVGPSCARPSLAKLLIAARFSVRMPLAPVAAESSLPSVLSSLPIRPGSFRTSSRSTSSSARLVVCSVAASCSLDCRALMISARRSSRCSAIAPVIDSMLASVFATRLTLSSLSTWSMRATSRLAVSAMFCSADASVRITGISRLSTSASNGLPGLPPVSWMIGVPVRLGMVILARVSALTGVSACSRSMASTRRGSSGASRSVSTMPTEMPLYCTELPSDRPVTGSLKITAYSRHVFSDEYFAAHNANSSRNTDAMIVNAPMRT